MTNTLAIIVTYNRCKMLRGCLDALKAQTCPCEILVVDNASTDDTQQIMNVCQSETIHYVRLPENIGGAGGFQFGLRWGAEHHYDYLWMMDDDVFPEPDALEELHKADSLVGDYGFLSSAALWIDGKECRMNRQAVSKQYFEHIELLKDGILAVRQATFVSCFLRRETVLSHGLPIREFFIWGDDIEFTRRLAVRAKLPCYLAGRSRVVHHMASNTGSDIATESGERLKRYHYAYRNENYLFRQEGLRGILYYLARCGYHFLRIWFRAKDRRLLRSWILIKAFFAGCFFNPRVEFVKGD